MAGESKENLGINIQDKSFKKNLEVAKPKWKPNK